ncbi:MAG: DAK2 domain-containing protein [Chloroflexi bacterium]|nr:DAK2 domain-containing protein [Chloroflexota bacterium]
MAGHTTYDGATLREMLREGTTWLEKNAQAVDALNVFPVPDGDTGTNMLLTMRAAMEEADGCPSSAASVMAQAVAHGALLGARGNSGVILSQILRGLAQGLAGKSSFDGPDLARALLLSAETAYRGVAQPVEGTMLTVIREAAEAARPAEAGGSVAAVLEKVVSAAQVSLANTPNLLPVLKEAGVVDAGGQGVVVLLEGALAHLQGRSLGEGYRTLGEISRDWLEAAGRLDHAEAGPPWGYCTQFLIQGQDLSLEEIRGRLEALGSSVLVVGDAAAARVHVHTLDPGAALSFGVALGALDSVKVENMQAQHAALLQARRAAAAAPPVPVVAVVPGEGLAQVFRSMGATEVVSGGQSMNPSTQEVARAVEAINADTVLVLPNNPNVIRTCQQVHLLTTRRVLVVPTRTIPQGIAALLALNQERSPEDNAQAMEENLASVRTIEVTTATRSVTLKGVAVAAGKPIGLLDRDLVAGGETALEVLNAVLDTLPSQEGSLVTLYYGEAVAETDAAAVAAALRARPDRPEVEVVWGGQPHYLYFVSVEA